MISPTAAILISEFGVLWPRPMAAPSKTAKAATIKRAVTIFFIGIWLLELHLSLDVSNVVLHFVSSDLVEYQQQPSGDFIRRMTRSQDDSVVCLALENILAGQPFEIHSIVR